jgi:branched-chain amino acid transport system substrate-binding protein
MRKRFGRATALGAVVIAACSMVIAGCGGSDEDSTSAGGGGAASAGGDGGVTTIKVGLSSPLSAPGDYQLGNEARKAIEGFIDWNNGQDTGVKFEIVGVLDDKGDAARGNSNVRKLLGDGAQVLLGDMSSAVSTAIMPAITRANVLSVIHGSWDDELTGTDKPRVFRVGGRNGALGGGIVDYLKGLQEEGGLETVGLLTEDTPFGLGLAKVIKAEAEEAGLAVKFSEQTFPSKTTDVTPQLLAMKRDAPDTMVILATLDARTLAIPQADEVGLKLPKGILASWNWPEYGGFWDVAGKSGEGVRYINFVMGDGTSESAKAFQEAKGEGKSVWGAWAWDAAMAVREAAKLAKSSDPDALAKAMIDVSFEGASGPVEFSTEEDLTFHNRPQMPFSVFEMTKEGEDPVEVTPGS